jgi:hypothetical protein
MGTKQHRCNKGSQLSYNGEFRGDRFFCSDCLLYHRISDADTYGDKLTKKELEAKKVRDAQEKMIRLIRSAKPISFYTEKINRTGTNFLDVEANSNGYVMDWGKIKSDYGTLLKDKVNDPKLMEDIIKYRDKILKHRISCDVKLISKGMEVGELKVYRILVEDACHIVKYWENQNIDPSGVNNKVYLFQRELMLSGRGGEVRVSRVPSRYTHIDKVKLKFSFS